MRRVNLTGRSIPRRSRCRAFVSSGSALTPITPRPARTSSITLAYFGAECIYGLRSIEFAVHQHSENAGDLQFGKLLVPGRIILYAQPHAPWTLPGRLAAPKRSDSRARAPPSK